MTDEAQIKFTIKLKIPKDDYATLTKWLKYYVADNTVQKVLEHGAQADIAKFLIRAREHMKTGKTAFERFTDAFYKERDE